MTIAAGILAAVGLTLLLLSLRGRSSSNSS
jgi:hypothetical protein